MAEKDRVFKGKLKNQGNFDYKNLYEFLYDTFMEEGYDVHESKYAEKNKGDSKNLDLNWTATKKISSYFSFEIKTNWIILGLKKVKIQKDGKESLVDDATVEITFTADLVKDPSNKWEKSFLKTFRRIYDQYIIKNRVEDYEMALYEEVNEIIDHVKSFFAIEGHHTF